MNKLLEISILPVLLTLFAFKAGVFLQKKTKSPMCNPILVAVILVLLVLLVTGMDLEVYQFPILAFDTGNGMPGHFHV